MTTRSVEPLGPVSIESVRRWITAIPLEAWPQQHRLQDGMIRPAMVNDQGWHEFGLKTDLLVDQILQYAPGAKSGLRMLSVVMPGHSIPPHADQQAPGWVYRVHVPLVTNDKALFLVDDETWCMEAGMAYRIDTRVPHMIRNAGDTPRIHFMVDCHA